MGGTGQSEKETETEIKIEIKTEIKKEPVTADFLEARARRINAYAAGIAALCDEKTAGLVRKLTAERKRQGLSQQDVAEVSGIRSPNIAGMETMKRKPSLETLMRYADVLGYEVEVTLRPKDGGHDNYT